MDLIDRYLAAIARRLPAAKAEDIVAEIRDDLLTRQEAREEMLGRPLDKREVAVLIKEVGHPLVVASRYRTGQYLIGPDAFPFFVATLRIVAIFVALALAVAAASAVVFGHVGIAQAVGQGIGSLATSAMFAFGAVVTVFVVLERTGFPADYLRKWRPEELPEVKDKQPNPWGSAFEVAIGVYFILWWCGVVPLPYAYSNVKGLTLMPDPVWTAIWWPVLALMVARLVFNLIQWLRPRWKMVLAALAVATAAGGLGLLYVIFQAGHWLTATGTLPTDQLADIDRGVNVGIHWGIIAVGAILVLQCLQELWRLAVGRPGRVGVKSV